MSDLRGFALVSDDPDDTTIDHSPIRASAEIDGEISHSQFSKGLSNVSAIEHHYDIDEGIFVLFTLSLRNTF